MSTRALKFRGVAAGTSGRKAKKFVCNEPNRGLQQLGVPVSIGNLSSTDSFQYFTRKPGSNETNSVTTSGGSDLSDDFEVGGRVAESDGCESASFGDVQDSTLAMNTSNDGGGGFFLRVPADYFEQKKKVTKSLEAQQRLMDQRKTEKHVQDKEAQIQIQRQIGFLSCLFAAQIKLRKILCMSNLFPCPASFYSQLKNNDSSVASLRHELANLLSHFLKLHKQLIINSAVKKELFSGKTAFPLEQAKRGVETKAITGWEYVDSHYSFLRQWVLSTLDTWHEAADLRSIRSNKHLSTLKTPPSTLIVSSVETQLPSLLKKLRVSSQLNSDSSQENYSLLSSAVEDNETYNDLEFYVAFLRNISMDTLHQQYSLWKPDDMMPNAELNGENLLVAAGSNRRKQKADWNRRASKGRMIRYVPIPKLVGFMSATTENTEDHDVMERMIASLFKF